MLLKLFYDFNFSHQEHYKIVFFDIIPQGLDRKKEGFNGYPYHDSFKVLMAFQNRGDFFKREYVFHWGDGFSDFQNTKPKGWFLKLHQILYSTSNQERVYEFYRNFFNDYHMMDVYTYFYREFVNYLSGLDNIDPSRYIHKISPDKSVAKKILKNKGKIQTVINYPSCIRLGFNLYPTDEEKR